MMWSPPILLQVSLEWLMSPQYITIVVLDIQVWQLSDTAPTPTPSVQKHWTELESNSLWIMYKVRCSKFFSSLCQWLRIKDNWIIPFRFFFFFGGGDIKGGKHISGDICKIISKECMPTTWNKNLMFLFFFPQFSHHSLSAMGHHWVPEIPWWKVRSRKFMSHFLYDEIQVLLQNLVLKGQGEQRNNNTWT